MELEHAAGITFVLGGARSGKSEVAEAVATTAAADGAPVTYVATGPSPDAVAGDGWAERIAAHRARRPKEWATLEVSAGDDLGAAISTLMCVVIVDSLGTWVAGLPAFGGGQPVLGNFVSALRRRRDAGYSTVVVGEEVGLGVHPSTAIGGEFRDALGEFNRRVADVANNALLVVAGRVLSLPALGVVPGPARAPGQAPPQGESVRPA